MKYFMLEQKGDVVDINIFGDITSWPWMESDVSSYTLAKQLDKAEAKHFNIHINSYGGEVAEALAIYSKLCEKVLKGSTVTTICDGFACSAASMVFMAGTERVVYPYSMLMIHNAWLYTAGNAEELRKAADDLEKIDSAAKSVYLDNTGLAPEALAEMLNAETWLNADDSLEYGFATVKRSSAGKAAAHYRWLGAQNKPEAPKAQEPEPNPQDENGNPSTPSANPTENETGKNALKTLLGL